MASRRGGPEPRPGASADTAANALDVALTADDERRARESVSAAVSRDDRATLLNVLAQHGASGNHLAIELLVVAVDQWGLARAAVRQVLVDETAVEEVTQDTLVAITTTLATFRGEAKFTTWLYTIAKRRAVDYLRRERRATEPPAGPAARLSSLIASREAVDQLLARLPADSREAVLLRDVHQLPYTEVAATLDCPESTARTRVARGRAIAAAVLEDTDGFTL